MSKTILLTLLLHCSLVGASVHAQTYPSKPIHVIVPYATGGAADGLMRPIGSRMSELLGQPVIIENKAGANGTVGALQRLNLRASDAVAAELLQSPAVSLPAGCRQPSTDVDQ